MSETDTVKLELENGIFAVLAEKEGHDKPIFLTDLTFGRILDEVIVPYECGKDFFIDGVPFNAKTLKRLKIILSSEHMKSTLYDLYWRIRRRSSSDKTMTLDEYYMRIDAAFRESTTDVTSQVISAYQRTIKDKVKDWIPKRDELISGAWTVFQEAIKAWVTAELK